MVDGNWFHYALRAVQKASCLHLIDGIAWLEWFALVVKIPFLLVSPELLIGRVITVLDL